MSFQWKEYDRRFSGEGIFFLTFTVVNRAKILGRLRKLETPNRDGHYAFTETSYLGNEVYKECNKLQNRHPGLKVLAKQMMPDHFHAVVWCTEDCSSNIKIIARGFAQACSKRAREEYQRLANATNISQFPTYRREHTLSQTAMPSPSSNEPLNTYECGNGANTLFEKPFIRTLAHRRQLRSMIDYTHNNPDNAMLRVMHPELYVIHRNIEVAGLRFDIMGKDRLLSYPDRQVIVLSRSLSEEQIKEEISKAKYNAERGVVTYTAAISPGEQAVSKAIRASQHPVVILLLNGFPPENSDAAKYFHPSGVYHTACGNGLLLLLAPSPENYLNDTLIHLTEKELQRKAEEKGFSYRPIPHSSQRWKMIAGNVMLKLISNAINLP